MAWLSYLPDCLSDKFRMERRNKMKCRIAAIFTTIIGLCLVTVAIAGDIAPMTGGVLIEGYEFGKDTGPKGTLSYNPETNEFKGTYRGLKMPAERRAMFAWVHDTVNQRSTYVGMVGNLEPNGSGRFTIKAADEFQNGNFGSNEILAFTAEETGSIDGTKLLIKPDEPSGTKSVAMPAFYLFSALPGADTDRHWCGHGQGFFYAKAPEKQTCYDCKCGTKYSHCIAAGKAIH
jgi:hypothetical protein